MRRLPVLVWVAGHVQLFGAAVRKQRYEAVRIGWVEVICSGNSFSRDVAVVVVTFTSARTTRARVILQSDIL